jgi:hypothetical protein
MWEVSTGDSVWIHNTGTYTINELEQMITAIKRGSSLTQIRERVLRGDAIFTVTVDELKSILKMGTEDGIIFADQVGKGRYSIYRSPLEGNRLLRYPVTMTIEEIEQESFEIRKLLLKNVSSVHVRMAVAHSVLLLNGHDDMVICASVLDRHQAKLFAIGQKGE